jgi:type IV secretory pathway TraG/TraD family ATPase VirD4
LRSPDPQTAEFIAKVLGKSQLKRTTQSQGGSADAGVGWSEQIAEEFVVMPSELQSLDSCHGYLKIVGSFHPARIRIPYAPDIKDRTPAFVSRDFKAERKAMAIQESTEVAGILDGMLDEPGNISLLGAFDEIPK